MSDLMSQLPGDRIWRAGADQVTTRTAEADILIGNSRVKAGKYSLYTHAPASGDWSLVVNSDPGIELIKIYAAAPPADLFTMTLAEANGGALLTISWGDKACGCNQTVLVAKGLRV